jgi:hypothetical protein
VVVAGHNQALAEHHTAAVHTVSERMVEVGFAGPIEADHKAAAAVHILVAVVVVANLVVLHRVVVVADQDRYTCVVASIRLRIHCKDRVFWCLLSAPSITFIERDYKRNYTPLALRESFDVIIHIQKVTASQLLPLQE